MAESSNIALSRRWIDEVWNQRLDATIRELLHPEAVGHLEGLVTRGVGEFLAAREHLTSAFPDFHIEVDDAIAQADKVALRWSATGTHRGTLMDMPATGRAVAFRGLTWFIVRNGRIVEGWDAWNQGRIFDELKAAQAKG